MHCQVATRPAGEGGETSRKAPPPSACKPTLSTEHMHTHRTPPGNYQGVPVKRGSHRHYQITVEIVWTIWVVLSEGQKVPCGPKTIAFPIGRGVKRSFFSLESTSQI